MWHGRTRLCSAERVGLVVVFNVDYQPHPPCHPPERPHASFRTSQFAGTPWCGVVLCVWCVVEGWVSGVVCVSVSVCACVFACVCACVCVYEHVRVRKEIAF